jgi:hypothetical protein
MNKTSDKLMNILIGISSGMILVGSFFKIQHYPYGQLIFSCGIISYIIISAVEIQRLKQIIKDNLFK